MEQYWFILTLLVTVSVGIVAFINKIFAEKWYNPQFSALVLYTILFFFSLTLGYIVWFVWIDEIGIKYIFICIAWGIQFYAYSVIMMKALRYLPTSTYFITVRLTSSFILLFIGILFFQDSVSLYQIIWFFLWVLAMSFLFEKDNSKRTDYKKWSIFLLLWIIFLVFGHTATKLLSIDFAYIPTFLSIAFASAIVTGIIFGFSHIKNNISDIRWIFTLNIYQSVFYFTYFYFLFYVYQIWDLGISYKIQSYSPFIPIILAAIIYRDKITKYKAIWICLSAVSLYFFT